MMNDGNYLCHSKKTKKARLSPLLIYILSVFALAIFLHGFFPVNYSSKSNAKRAGARNGNLHRHVDKLAFVVIDALRYDFVMRADGLNYMPFTLSSILNKDACYLNVKAHSPTVTLPRLKAITSGSLSTFIDVILNFMTPAFEEDNFIDIAASSGLKLVFYGDETWLKLFPNSFIRSEGTHSFFTYDYYEVDDNVTRHIDDELKRNDWDIIILHYLGLDHIGHTEGPTSSLVKSKLLEMDNIIKKFNDHFKELEKSQNLRTMLILTGDHGMKDSGSHGGVTYPEVTIPLVSVGKPCLTLPGWPEDYTPLQVDIAPTLSAMFGLPFPANNMGKIIPSLLHYVQRDDILKTLETNRIELQKFTEFNKGLQKNSLKYALERWLWWLSAGENNEEVGADITREYFHCLNNISQWVVTSHSDFKLLYLFAGTISLWTFTIYLLSEALHHYSKPRNFIQWFFVIGTILHAISLLSSSFIEEEHQTWYFFWVTFCVISTLKAVDCYTGYSNLHKAKFLVLWVLVAVTHRLLRKMNQTGDKWAFLPDIKSYLYAEHGQSWLFYIFLLGIGMVFLCALLERSPLSHLVTYGICLLSVVCYRIASGVFKLQYLAMYPSSKWLQEVVIFWMFLIIFTFQSVHNHTPFYLVWLLLGSFYLRPHNVILLSVEVFISKRLYKLFHNAEDSAWNSLAHIWLGNLFYFYQGNGNSLSNVDVAAGFVGVQSYNPLYSGLMIAAHCFNGQILAFILSPKLDFSFALSRLIPLTVYCTGLLVQLNHLFIWTVFSPKLLFETSITFILLVLMIVNYLFNYWKLAR